MNGLTLSLVSFFAIGTAFGADAPSSNALPDEGEITTESVFMLQGNYIGFGALNYKSGDELPDLIARSNGGISLLPPAAKPLQPIQATVLPNAVVYLRLPGFTPPKDWATLQSDLDASIDYWHAYGTVVDLRNNSSNDYAGAAQAECFFKSDSPLQRYTPATISGMMYFHPEIVLRHLAGPVTVLVNSHTSGAAEVLAALLKADGALVVGAKTAGATSFYDDWTLSTGQVLHFTISPLSSSHAVVPVNPDVVVDIDPNAEGAALEEIADGHLADVIQEAAQRHRMNEAALVRGDDPEWDAYLALLEKKPDQHVLLSLPPIRDPALITAIDSIEAIRVTQISPPPQPNATPASSGTASVQ